MFISIIVVVQMKQTDKGKLIEKWGRKVTDLKLKNKHVFMMKRQRLMRGMCLFED